MGVFKVIWNTLSDFTVHTTIGGLCNAGNASSRLRQILWLVIFFSFSGYTVKLLVDNVEDYLDYNVTTTTAMGHVPVFNFPAVTICNQNK